MTLDKDDQKEIVKIVQGIIDKSVAPKLEKIEDHSKKHDEQLQTVNRKLDATMEMCAKNTEEITLLRDDFTDTGYTMERIETKLDATIRRQDDASVKNSQLARRLLKLETKRT